MVQFQKTILDERVSFEKIDSMTKDWEVVILSILDAMIHRFNRDPSYQYIDMKLNIITGKDFESLADETIDFKGKSAIFGWIQGRGLEALVGHAKWLSNTCTILSLEEKEKRISSLNEIIQTLLNKLEEVRKLNKGHLFFTFSPDGKFFKIDDQGKRVSFSLTEDNSLMSDLFYVKGMNVAARYTENKEVELESKKYFKKILKDIDDGLFKGDQVSFDPKNKVKAIPGIKGHGMRMISLGGLAIFAEAYPEENFWFEKGCEYLQYILLNHVNYKKQWADLFQYDFSERITSNGLPYSDEKGILSDPGHALEYIGLSAKFLLVLKNKGNYTAQERETLELAEEHFGYLLKHCFVYGSGLNSGGLVKAFDLTSRTAINDDMPWWNLPETMRAAVQLLELFPSHPQAKEFLRILISCSNSYFKNYVNPNAHLLAYQTIDKDCKPVDIIPATPDADPGYHTGLSIIDCLGSYQRLLKK